MTIEGFPKEESSAKRPCLLGTKAEVLERLCRVKGSFNVPDLLFFTASSWLSERDRIVSDINQRFCGTLVAVRSSSLREDGASSSMAGAFHSELNIPSDDEGEIGRAIDLVIEAFDGREEDQVLIQEMVTDVFVAGVIMTRDMEQGGPFYVVNYDDDSGRTDAITSGAQGVHKTVRVLHSCELQHIKSHRLRKMIAFARELEALFISVPLDIEFAINKTGSVHLLQVRRITVEDNWGSGVESRVNEGLRIVAEFVNERSQPQIGLAGAKTIFGNMPDWNPAEILGATPRALAVSLYREIITRDIWRRARERMGYRAVPPHDLMVTMFGRPYIDVRCSLNSFLPAGIDESLAETLVGFGLERLDEHPEFHDKIEFDIATTSIDFSFEDTVRERYSSILSAAQKTQFRDRLTELTIGCLDAGSAGGVKRAEAEISTLKDWQQKYVEQASAQPLDLLSRVQSLIESSRSLGTLPFSVLARHGFIAESLIRSAVNRDALSPEREGKLKESINTITGDFAADMGAVYEGAISEVEFMTRYGHLRPGTYDILSRRYQDRNFMFSKNDRLQSLRNSPEFVFTSRERQAINSLLSESRLNIIDAEGLLDYASRAIRGREYAKFVFTWNLSEVLECLARWGEKLGIDRENLSCIPLPKIMNTLSTPVIGDSTEYFKEVAGEQRSEWSLGRSLNLSYLLRGPHDLYVSPVHRSAPNFVTNKSVDSAIKLVGPQDPFDLELTNRIVCIENADPGYDWVFAKNINGLITKFGGVNSHMSIRCAELGLPAAIGCGEMLFDEIIEKGTVELNCASHILRAVHGKN